MGTGCNLLKQQLEACWQLYGLQELNIHVTADSTVERVKQQSPVNVADDDGGVRACCMSWTAV